MTNAFDAPDESLGCLLLAWSGRTASFALDAAAIERVVDERDWGGADVLDLSEALDLDRSLEPVRVLEFRVGDERLGLRAFGAVRLCTVAPGDLLDVPPLIRARDAGRFVQRLAMLEGAPALWVLDPDAIHRDAMARRALPSEGLLERTQ